MAAHPQPDTHGWERFGQDRRDSTIRRFMEGAWVALDLQRSDAGILIRALIPKRRDPVTASASRGSPCHLSPPDVTMHGPNAIRRSARLLLLLFSVGGCAPPTLTDEGSVSAVAWQRRIHIMNRTPRPVFTFVVGRNAAALINWAACVDVEQCPPIQPGRTRAAPYPESPNETEAVVYWWFGVADANGHVNPDSIHAKVVRLR